jgi:hypothetical protein
MREAQGRNVSYKKYKYNRAEFHEGYTSIITVEWLVLVCLQELPVLNRRFTLEAIEGSS